MVTDKMLDSVTGFIDALSERIRSDGSVHYEEVAAVAGLCSKIVAYRPDHLTEDEVSSIVGSVSEIVRRDLPGGDRS